MQLCIEEPPQEERKVLESQSWGEMRIVCLQNGINIHFLTPDSQVEIPSAKVIQLGGEVFGGWLSCYNKYFMNGVTSPAEKTRHSEHHVKKRALTTQQI